MTAFDYVFIELFGGLFLSSVYLLFVDWLSFKRSRGNENES